MFSQYSWWDFIKVVITLAIPYYGFVAWKYYRQDIIDWFSNKGQKDQPVPVATSDDGDDEAELDTSGLYSSKTYSTDSEPSTPTVTKQPVVAETHQEVAVETPTEEEVVPEPQPVVHAEPVDVELSEGVIVNEQTTNTFELGLTSTPIRPAERSLSDVINAARRMKADDNGNFTPYNPQDAQAVELADTLNEQKSMGSLLAGVPFTR